MRGQYVQITKIRYLCFRFGTLAVHSRYSRMAGFGRREIEYMQALCIFNIYIEYYSVDNTQSMKYMLTNGATNKTNFYK